MLVEGLATTTTDATTKRLVDASTQATRAGRAYDGERLARAAIGRDERYMPARMALGRALEARGLHAEAAGVYAEVARLAPLGSGVTRSIRRLWSAPLAGFGIVAGLIWGIWRVVGRQLDARLVFYALILCAALLIGGVVVVTLRRRRRFAGLSAEDRAVVEAHVAGSFSMGVPAGSLALMGLSVVLLAGAGFIYSIGTKPSLSMKVGDCFTLSEASFQSVSTVPCGFPHVTEIYADFVDPAPVGAGFPGLDAIRATAMPTCEAEYASFIGAPYAEGATFKITILVPEKSYWDRGMRRSFCSVSRPDLDQVTGSARGSGG